MPLTKTQKAYIAGIIDGEGSIMIMQSKSRSSGNYYFPVVKIANTNKEVIDWIIKVVGKGKIGYLSRMNKRCKDVYHYTIASNEAVELLKDVFPYLIIKKKQANVAITLRHEHLNALKEAPINKHGVRMFGNGHPIPDYLRAFREACYWFVRDLNGRSNEKLKYGYRVLSLLPKCL